MIRFQPLPIMSTPTAPNIANPPRPSHISNHQTLIELKVYRRLILQPRPQIPPKHLTPPTHDLVVLRLGDIAVSPLLLRSPSCVEEDQEERPICVCQNGLDGAGETGGLGGVWCGGRRRQVEAFNLTCNRRLGFFLVRGRRKRLVARRGRRHLQPWGLRC